MVDSFSQFAGGAYYAAKLGRPYYRTIGAAPTEAGGVRTATVNETVDESVFERWRRDPRYRPANLAAWSDRLSVDPATVRGSVLASDGRTVVPER